ncbi:ketosteroid isomerase family protein [Nonomuraea angiospora]|uniref:ketosteroid isomerase family protein n=1 Tax=Nonomuraea angiospora TaxID=46172 RepID=UPI0029BD3FB5|nr:ketosteroid isomerase family protein [Nonomuraea angiospora]MDX3103437.1 ketosteroid isomerase family protein [Nonomuraea angiospora]
MDVRQKAYEFIDSYYDVFKTARANIGSMYRENSVLNYDGDEAVGPAAIVDALADVANWDYASRLVDIMPQADGTAVVLVTGALTLPSWDGAVSAFAETFVLMQDDDGSYYADYDTFRWSRL